MTWLGTLSGKKIDLLNPDPTQIELSDIAVALSRVPRFGGHTLGQWSVLQHSIAVSNLVSDQHKLAALLHDASEAYICDIPSPLKRLLGDAYYEVERRVQEAIGKKFEVDLVNLPMAVKRADAIMLMTEHEKFQPTTLEWETDYSDGLRALRVMDYIANSPSEFADLLHKYTR